MSKNHYIIPIFVPHLGCPHDCVFCNQRRITGLSTDVTPNYVRKTIEEHLSTFPNRKITIEVAFYGGSFTGIQNSIQKELLAVPFEYKNKGKIDAIRLSTRPDYIDKEVLNLLNEYKVDTIELGVQSLNDEVLNKSGRGHNVQQVYIASKLIKEYGFNLGLQMMIGLVEDNRERAIFTAKEFVKLEPYCVRIYPTLVIKDTYLEKMYNNNDYTPLSLEEAVDTATILLMLFEYYNINVIRIGLQPTDNIRLGKDVIAGPFHPSIRQLVESNIYRIILKDYLDRYYEDMFNKTLIIETNGKNISNIAGQKSSNIDFMVDRYKLKNVKIYIKDIPRDIIEITIVNSKKATLSRKKAIENYIKKI
ncbi:radical SAM protein [Schnuerera sp. xch1]|uniref:elongator complex protein 3 n=1 Tax=Schnuerera sp. xch1 TaxID=2874283 RepID=UPI001CBB8FB2|nr:radical SAM protein [Schnuerera sp. xch1]MBZ2173903.1 radical SAM protein [Schnuerera sp. xch1]